MDDAFKRKIIEDGALLHWADDSFSIMDSSGALYCIVDDEARLHAIILEMLANKRPIYDSHQELRHKKAVPPETYPAYQQRYLQYWNHQKNRITLVIKNGHALAKCALLIKQFDNSLDSGTVKEHLLCGKFILHQTDCDNPSNAQKLFQLIRELQETGANVELYQQSEKMELEDLASYFHQEF